MIIIISVILLACILFTAYLLRDKKVKPINVFKRELTEKERDWIISQQKPIEENRKKKVYDTTPNFNKYFVRIKRGNKRFKKKLYLNIRMKENHVEKFFFTPNKPKNVLCEL